MLKIHRSVFNVLFVSGVCVSVDAIHMVAIFPQTSHSEKDRLGSSSAGTMPYCGITVVLSLNLKYHYHLETAEVTHWRDIQVIFWTCVCLNLL